MSRGPGLCAYVVPLTFLGVACGRPAVEHRPTEQGTSHAAPDGAAARTATATSSAAGPSAARRLDRGCRATTLLDVGAVLAGAEEPCRPWIEAVAGRVLAQDPIGSAVLWTHRTAHRTGIVVGALHTLGGTPAGAPRAATLFDPAAASPTPKLRWPTSGAYDDFLSPMFLLLVPPAATPPRALADTPPRVDFFLAVVDAQKSNSGRPRFTPVGEGPIPVDDPLDATGRAPTWAPLSPHDRVLLVGVPHDGELRGRAAASSGSVLTDDEVREAVLELASAGDGEAAVPYDPMAEAFIEAPARRGMSGGGAFDAEGRFVGVIVRATDRHPTRGFVRIVRASWIVAELTRARGALPAELRSRIEGYVEPVD